MRPAPDPADPFPREGGVDLLLLPLFWLLEELLRLFELPLFFLPRESWASAMLEPKRPVSAIITRKRDFISVPVRYMIYDVYV